MKKKQSWKNIILCIQLLFCNEITILFLSSCHRHFLFNEISLFVFSSKWKLFHFSQLLLMTMSKLNFIIISETLSFGSDSWGAILCLSAYWEDLKAILKNWSSEPLLEKFKEWFKLFSLFFSYKRHASSFILFQVLFHAQIPYNWIRIGFR